MPVQINEVIIRAVVDPKSDTGDDIERTESRENDITSEEEIIEKVFEIIQEKKER